MRGCVVVLSLLVTVPDATTNVATRHQNHRHRHPLITPIITPTTVFTLLEPPSSVGPASRAQTGKARPATVVGVGNGWNWGLKTKATKSTGPCCWAGGESFRRDVILHLRHRWHRRLRPGRRELLVLLLEAIEVKTMFTQQLYLSLGLTAGTSPCRPAP